MSGAQSGVYALGDRTPQIADGVWLAPGSRVIGAVELREKVSVWFNAVIRADVDTVTVGRGTNIQDGAVVHQDPGYPTTIGADVLIGHNAIVHGSTVGDEALIGMGALVLSGASVGGGALIGAGALVREGQEIPEGSLAVGSPARVIRQLDAEARREMAAGVAHYRRRAADYDDNLRLLEGDDAAG